MLLESYTSRSLVISIFGHFERITGLLQVGVLIVFEKIPGFQDFRLRRFFIFRTQNVQWTDSWWTWKRSVVLAVIHGSSAGKKYKRWYAFRRRYIGQRSHGLVVYKCHRQGDYAADQNDICLGLMRITGLSTSNLKVGLHLTKCIHSIHSTHNQLIDFSRMDLNSRLHTDIFTVHWACIYREWKLHRKTTLNRNESCYSFKFRLVMIESEVVSIALALSIFRKRLRWYEE